MPGRPLTRQLYAIYSGDNQQLKQHYHVRVTNEVKLDLGMGRKFLHNNTQFSRPFLDFNKEVKRDKAFTSDAALLCYLFSAGEQIFLLLR